MVESNKKRRTATVTMKQLYTNAIRKKNARSGSELVDELDEKAGTMLVQIFHSQSGELLLCLDEVDGDLSSIR